MTKGYIMKKLLLSLCLMPLLAYGTQEEKKELVGMTYNQKAGLWQQLTAKRTAEQDLRTKMPWFCGKQLEVNLSQLKNYAAIALPIYNFLNLEATYYGNSEARSFTFRDTTLWIVTHEQNNALAHRKQNQPTNSQTISLRNSKSNLYLHIGAILYGVYGVYTGERKNPFRIVDTEEAH
jgi:hypothetical protein